MALTAAEKQRRYRLRRDQDPERRQEYLQKEKKRWKMRKAKGQIKDVASLSEREKRRVRKYWKVTKAEYRKRQKKTANIVTPPNSPSHVPDQEQLPQQLQDSSKTSKKILKKKKNRRKLMKKIDLLTSQLEQQKRATQKYKKRWQREKSKVPDTPRTKTMKLLRHATSETVRKKLLMHNIIVDQIKKRYVKEKKERQKQTYTYLLASSMVKKYRLQKTMQAEFGFSARCWNKSTGAKSSRKMYASRGVRYRQNITNFFTRDDNSRSTTGKKETLTKHKDKQQKRLLNDSMRNLHVKYCSENPTQNISYTLFTRLRPFWVVPPKESDRLTCSCKLDENFRFVITKLHALKALSTADMDEVAKMVSCDTNSKACMYGECNNCPPLQLDSVDMNIKTTWKKWTTIKESHEEIGKSVTRTVKKEVEGTVGDLILECKCLIERYKRHSFNIHQQHRHYRTLRQSMSDTECLIHVDFSENYVCKLSNEIQSMHFGASKKQITLHTGVYYVGANSKATSFCSLSDSLQHGPEAVWAHLQPVLDSVQANEAIDTIHFFSDGPTTQYRQKANFYLFAENMAKRGIKVATWNFHEAGHGKGAPDGVGAAVKRLADQLVLQGNDIANVDAMYDSLREKTSTSIKIFKIPAADIKSTVPTSLLPIPGTMALHQVLWQKNYQVFYRDVSCLCQGSRNICACYDLKTFDFMGNKKSRGEKKASTRSPKNNQTNPPSSQASSEGEEARKTFFEELLKELQQCKSFDELQLKCKDFAIPYEVPEFTESAVKDDQIDKDAEKLLPKDSPIIHKKVPVMVSADGDCLPHSGSFIAFGNEDGHKEMRARIVMELAIHKDIYLDNGYLRRGMHGRAQKLTASYCLYSGSYDPGKRLTSDEIEALYEKEVLDVVRDSAYMGIWQMFALASVLGCELHSIYPNKGNATVRKDLHRVLLPRVKRVSKPASIMWTTTRNDMRNPEYFVPNHFVPMAQRWEPSDHPNNTEFLGKYVAVRYEGKPYPGVVTDVDDSELEVKCLHKVGKNFFWPKLEDICWYKKDDIIGIICEPTKVTDKHYEVPGWTNILKHID